MKRFIASFTALLLFLLCACKGTENYVSDFGNFVKNKIESTYNEANEKAKQIGKEIYPILTREYVDEYEIVTVKPQQVNDASLLSYNKLTKRQKQLYSIFITAFENMELKKINITKYAGDNVFTDASIAHRAVLCDRPDIFWAPKTFSLLTFKNAKDTYIQFAKDDKEDYYGITKAEKEKMQSELNAVLDKVLADIGPIDSVFEKELYIHDYICQNVTYDNDAAADIKNADMNTLSAYGALVKGKAVCEGYSKAFELLCTKSGIPCNVVYGEHENTPHMWNIVDLYGSLYYVDLTFDDSSSVSILHTYFNTTKADMLKDHIFYDNLSKNKKSENLDRINFYNENCESTEFNYFFKKGLFITEDCGEAIKALIKEKENGKNSAELKNITSRSIDDAFLHLRRKARGFINLDYYYRLENEDTIIAVWKN